MKKEKSTRRLVQLSLLSAIIVVLAFTPLGYIPISPALRPVTIHIPVIIGAIILGPGAGGILGAVFGLVSLLINTFQPTATSFAFSPFYTMGQYSGNFTSLIVCFVPRILIGVVAGYLFIWLKRLFKSNSLPIIISAVAGSLTNTIFVMGGIYIFFADAYSAVRQQPVGLFFKFIMAVVGTNGVPEAITAAIITFAVAKPLIKFFNK